MCYNNYKMLYKIDNETPGPLGLYVTANTIIT